MTATGKPPAPAAPATYAVVATGGKQYRVSEGQWLLVERLPVPEGETINLAPLLLVDGSGPLDGEGLSEVTVSARVLAHERGPKLRVVKFKPKRGYKRRTGHRQELTRIQIESIARASSKGSPGTAHGGGTRASAQPETRADLNQEEENGA